MQSLVCSLKKEFHFSTIVPSAVCVKNTEERCYICTICTQFIAVRLAQDPTSVEIQGIAANISFTEEAPCRHYNGWLRNLFMNKPDTMYCIHRC